MIKIIKTLLKYRELLWALITRDIKVRYKQSIIGAGWAILQPLLMMIIFTFVFSRFTRVPTNGVPYPIFSYCALLPWTFFASSLTFAIPSIVNNSNLVTKVYVPRCIFPVAAIISCCVDFFIASTIFFVMMFYFKIGFSLKILFVGFILLIQIVLTAGIVFFFSMINVYFRDVRYLIPLGLQMALFLSPVIYSIDSVPANYQFLYLLNPMAGIIESYRAILLYDQWLSVKFILPAVIISFFVFLGATVLFNRFEGRFADVI